MATYADLSRTLESWIHRLRWQRALVWASRGLLLGLILCLGLGLPAVVSASILRQEFLTWVVSVSLLVPCLAGVIAFLWPISSLHAARYFDLRFRLGERVSTALELLEQPGPDRSELQEAQLQDAVAAARLVDPRRDLSFRYDWREGVVCLLLIVLLGTVWFRGEDWFEAARQERQVEQAVAQQVTRIEEIIRQIESSETLSDGQKETLTTPLQNAQERLQENPALENSVGILTSTSQQIQVLSDPQAQQMSQALQEAGAQLSRQEGSLLQSIGQELAQRHYINAASRLANINVSDLSAGEQQQLAAELADLANLLQATHPELAEALRQAASALQSGDEAAAQQTLRDAAQALSDAGQQVTFSQMANQTANQLQQGASQVLAAGGGSQQVNAAGQGSNPNGQSNGTGGSGSGTGSWDLPSGSDAGSSPIPQNNGPGEGGQTAYEQIYAPSLLGGEGGPQIGLPSSGDNTGEVMGEGPSMPGDPGTSLVPYTEVYAQYEEIRQQAMENGEIPPQFTEIIRNYFDSLRP